MPEPARKRLLRRRGRNHFSVFADEGNHFVHQVAELLQCDRNKAARITRAVLHALRDKMPPDAAMSFAQGLPMALKAVFIDGYDVSGKPLPLRRSLDFFDYIYCLGGRTADHDFPELESTEDALLAVYIVLSRYMEQGQLNMIRQHLGKQTVRMLDIRSRAFL